MTIRRRLPVLLAALAVAASALAALALPSVALASKCGDQVLADWADNGEIDRTYELACYHDALDSIPADIRDYANAEEIISRALAEAMRGNQDGDGGETGGSSGGPSGGSGTPSDPDEPREPAGPVSPTGGPAVTPAVDASDASSVPIPLLLLAAMSLLLLGAGGLGYLSRRRNATADGLLDGPGDDDLHA